MTNIELRRPGGRTEKADPTADAGLLPDVMAHLGRQLRLALEPPTSLLPERLHTALLRLDRCLAARREEATAAMQIALVEAIPALRTFAFSLVYNVDRADDLVQDTLARAVAKADTFTPGTYLIAWLFTILRNLFYSEQRKRKREVEDVDGALAGRLTSLPNHEVHLELADFRLALTGLPAPQREALMLIGAQGLSYDEAARICGVAVGTIKSRVNRARTTLVQRLGMDGTGDIGPDAITRAVSGSG